MLSLFDVLNVNEERAIIRQKVLVVITCDITFQKNKIVFFNRNICLFGIFIKIKVILKRIMYNGFYHFLPFLTHHTFIKQKNRILGMYSHEKGYFCTPVL